MSWQTIRQFFRDNPRVWIIVAAATLSFALVFWGVWGRFQLQSSQSSASQGGDDMQWSFHADEDLDLNCAENRSSFPDHPITIEAQNVTNLSNTRLHLTISAFYKKSVSCDIASIEGSYDEEAKISVNGSQDWAPGTTHSVVISFDPKTYSCGSMVVHGSFTVGETMSGGGPAVANGQKGAGFVVTTTYGKNCGSTGGGGGAGAQTASVLSVKCGATQNVLTWTLPAGHNSNTLLRSVNNGNGAAIFGGPNNIGGGSLTTTTFTDTNVQAGNIYTYTHKASAGAASNKVTCPSGQGTQTPAVSYPKLSCAPLSQTVEVNQPADAQASGGSGTYQWNFYGGGVLEAGGNESVTVSYASVGQKTLQVNSGGQTARCLVNVVPVGQANQQAQLNVTKRGLIPSSTGELMALTILSGQQAQFIVRITNTGSVATSGLVVRDEVPPGMSYQSGSTQVDGQPVASDAITTGGLVLDRLEPGDTVAVQWSALADATDQIAGGPNYSNPRATVSSDGSADIQADIAVTVYGAGSAGAAGVPTGPSGAVIAALLVAAALTLLYSGYTRSSAYRRREADVISRDQGPLDFRS